LNVDKPTAGTKYASIMASERIQHRIERLQDKADEAVARYDWEAVSQASRAVLALVPENQDAITFLAAVDRASAETSTLRIPKEPPLEYLPSPSPPQPTSFANGGYQIKRFLGEGGKKKVYMAHDMNLNRDFPS